jgi:hypothetical protein
VHPVRLNAVNTTMPNSTAQSILFVFTMGAPFCLNRGAALLAPVLLVIGKQRH